MRSLFCEAKIGFGVASEVKKSKRSLFFFNEWAKERSDILSIRSKKGGGIWTRGVQALTFEQSENHPSLSAKIKIRPLVGFWFSKVIKPWFFSYWLLEWRCYWLLPSPSTDEGNFYINFWSKDLKSYMHNHLLSVFLIYHRLYHWLDCSTNSCYNILN